MATPTFDDKKPDLKLVKQVLYQAFNSGSETGAVDIYAKAWCLREMELADYRRLEQYMLDNDLIYEAMPDHFAMSDKGMRELTGSGLGRCGSQEAPRGGRRRRTSIGSYRSLRSKVAARGAATSQRGPHHGDGLRPDNFESGLGD